MRETRKLAAILAADIVGFSRMAGADEDRTLARLRALRSDLIDPTIAVHHGRVFKRTGDGILSEFRSVVDAVRCAIEIQSAMIDRNAGVEEARRIEFRVGVHLGDVVEESDGDLMGDGVNIAARLEGVAKPGTICLSDDAYRQVKARLDLAVVDLGPTMLKNIAVPVHAYSLQVGGAVEAKPAEPARLALPDKPSIAVLPFQNMSGDPKQEYFVDGMVEDIITGLSRIRWLFVIARNSSFTYKGKAVDIRQVGRELGVRYVLEGGIRKAGRRLRITAQLIEAENGAHIWADRFDGAVEDIFDLQDEITEKVVAIIEPNLIRAEIERSARKRPESLDAQDLIWRALPHTRTWRPADSRIAIKFLESALALESNNAYAHAQIANCRYNCFIYGGLDPNDRDEAVRHARIVVTSAADNANALSMAALYVALLDKDYAAAKAAIDRALSHNPSSAQTHFLGAFILAVGGDCLEARTLATRALRLSPRDTIAFMAHHALGVCDLYDGKFDEACAHYGRAVQSGPARAYLYMDHAAVLSLAGRTEEAKKVARHGLDLEPNWRIRLHSEIGYAPEIADKLIAGSRLLGLTDLDTPSAPS